MGLFRTNECYSNVIAPSLDLNLKARFFTYLNSFNALKVTRGADSVRTLSPGTHINSNLGEQGNIARIQRQVR